MQRPVHATKTTSVMQDSTARRAARLSELFGSFLRGSRTVRTANDTKFLLEALCSQENRAATIEKMTASTSALESLKVGLRFDVSPSFLNGPLKDFLVLLRDLAVKLPCGGDLLKLLLTIVVQPSTLWTAAANACKARQLCSESEHGFSWLLLELLCWTNDPPINVDSTAQEITDSRFLLESENSQVQSLGRRILHVLEAKKSKFDVSASGPGGRHDNDFVDYRKVSIFPSNGELTCRENPFYRRADALAQMPLEARVHAHLDNQFRLLREDFLAELREDIGTPVTTKKARRPKMRLRGLSLAGFYCGRSRRKNPFALAKSVTKGLGPFATLLPQDRKVYLRDNTRFLKHQSFGCILDGVNINSFATLFRTDELLMEDPPIVTLRTPDESSLQTLLLSLKMSHKLEFVLMDTSVFAYEPILRCLQTKVEMPLWEQLLSVNAKEIEATDYRSSTAPIPLLERLEETGAESLQKVLALRKLVHLDESQMQSLLSGLGQAVSLIQGPPGKLSILAPTTCRGCVLTGEFLQERASPSLAHF